MPRLRRDHRSASSSRRSPHSRARAAGGRVTPTKRRQPLSAQLCPRRGWGDACPRDAGTPRHPVWPIHSRRFKSLSGPVGARSASACAPDANATSQPPAVDRTRTASFLMAPPRDCLRRRPVPVAHRLRPSGRLSNCAVSRPPSSHASRAQSHNRVLLM